MSLYPQGVAQMNLNRAGADGASINTQGGAASITDSPGLQGSMQQVLMDNLGQYVQIDFLIGINTIVRRSGILYSVGRGYIVLYDESEQGFILCDAFSAKFINFYGGQAPAGSALNPGLGIVTPDETGALRPNPGNTRPMGQADMDRFFNQGAAAYPGGRTLGDR